MTTWDAESEVMPFNSFIDGSRSIRTNNLMASLVLGRQGATVRPRWAAARVPAPTSPAPASCTARTSSTTAASPTCPNTSAYPSSMAQSFFLNTSFPFNWFDFLFIFPFVNPKFRPKKSTDSLIYNYFFFNWTLILSNLQSSSTFTEHTRFFTLVFMFNYIFIGALFSLLS